jgi:pimeloyl-ACP methyl ester carboxylesterase
MENETNAHKYADETGSVIVYALAEEHKQPVGKPTEGLWYGSLMKSLVTGDQMDYHAYNSPGSGLNDTKTSYDDVHYIQSVDSMLAQKINMGSRYLIGFSEGGQQARHTAAFMPEVKGVGLIHPADTGTEATLKYPQTMVQVTGDLDTVLNRAGASTYKSILGNWEARWPKMALSDPTRPFHEFAKVNGCSGAPHVETSAEQIVTKYTADQCTSGRPVTDVDRKFGQHAVDGAEHKDLGAWAVGKLVGEKDPTFDSFRYIVDQLTKE